MSKKKTINVTPYHLESEIKDGTIILTFHDSNKIVNIKLQRWWIAYIARDLHKIIKSERDAIERLKDSLKNG